MSPDSGSGLGYDPSLESGECSSVCSQQRQARRGQSEPWLGQLQSESRHHPGIIQWPVHTGAMWPGDRPGVTRTARITSWWVSSRSRWCQCSCVSRSEPSEPESSAAPGQWERERGSLHFETGGSSSPVQPAQTHCTPPSPARVRAKQQNGCRI